jgi:glycosyltransferase involved in cell wall biosynthesis
LGLGTVGNQMTSTNGDPLVSVVIASYNRAVLLEAAVRSGLNQDWPNIEVVVSDDASSDNSIETLRKIGDPRVRFTAHPGHVGVWKNWTTALQMARGDYVVFLGDDDWIDPTFVRKHIRVFRKHTGIEAVFSSLEDRPDDGSPSRFMRIPLPPETAVDATWLVDGLLDDQVFFGAALFRRDCAQRIWADTEQDGMVADWGLILGLALQPLARVGSWNEVLYIKRLHAKRLSSRFKEVTALMAAVCERMSRMAVDGKAKSRLKKRSVLERITLSRHHAAEGNSAACRSVLWSCFGERYAQGIVISQLLQSYFLPGRLIQTSREQRPPETA